MERSVAKKLVVEMVANLQGCKGTELAAHVGAKRLEGDFELPVLLEELVREGELEKVEYVLPYMDWRIKSLYLPKGTKVRVLGSEE